MSPAGAPVLTEDLVRDSVLGFLKLVWLLCDVMMNDNQPYSELCILSVLIE